MLNLLCSERGRAELRQAGVPRRWPGRVALLGLPEAGRADAALITRDVVGASTDDVLTPETAAFYEALLAAPGLRWVHTYASGTDRRIYAALRARGVRVTNSPGANAEAVAQTALAGFLYFSRQLHRAREQQLQQRWEPLRHDEVRALRHLEAVIVGWGAVGRRLGACLSMLGVRCRVLRHSGEPIEEGWPTDTYARFRQWVGEVDWVFFVCPLSPATESLFNIDTLSALDAGRPLGVVNVARGRVVDAEALLAAHARGLVRHAYLDTFRAEPLPADDPLWRCRDFLLSPHMAGTSDGNRAEVIDRFIGLLVRELDGEA
ncbi:Glyoxylate/hydroxypyruvate reductase B [Pigmentiphaga humi]|uniref:Glyoxylate/hydroxypyruvate reductase B n=1 Tax=Pigmentiphaga humi TaxID=2478468 RepID=A0A3P4B3X1_9BURK|nr:NAD(P)-dependent oxidoreductase [Pigmentiphaga humi]VCU70328.1 Glyoxylate/hydroxypyruvate reductase B [Pigmentiphaga humi]